MDSKLKLLPKFQEIRPSTGFTFLRLHRSKQYQLWPNASFQLIWSHVSGIKPEIEGEIKKKEYITLYNHCLTCFAVILGCSWMYYRGSIQGHDAVDLTAKAHLHENCNLELLYGSSTRPAAGNINSSFDGSMNTYLWLLINTIASWSVGH